MDKPGQVITVMQNGKVEEVGKSSGFQSPSPAASSNGSSSSKVVVSSVALDYCPAMEKEGRAVQCIALPAEVTPDQYIVSITPNHQSSHVIVVTAPKTLHRRISALCGITAQCHQDEESNTPRDSSRGADTETEAPSGSSNCTETASGVSQNAAMQPSVVDEPSTCATNQQTGNGGCILVYKANVENGRMVLLHETPVVTHAVASLADAVTSLLLLPRDIAQGLGEDTDALSALSASPAGACSSFAEGRHATPGNVAQQLKIAQPGAWRCQCFSALRRTF